MVEPISITLSVVGIAGIIVTIIAKLCKGNRFNCDSECFGGDCKWSIKNIFKKKNR